MCVNDVKDIEYMGQIRKVAQSEKCSIKNNCGWYVAVWKEGKEQLL